MWRAILEAVASDRELIQIVDAAMAEAVRRSGDWIACRPGCYECCFGPFAISASDAARLKSGLAAVEPDVAERVRERARSSMDRMRAEFPGDTVARVLSEEDAARDELCPALDPDSGTCDLYTARPVTCRTFGPAVRFEEGDLGACELCYEGATDEEIAACAVEVKLDLDDTETIVAFALLED